jgi:hypothetical protein
MMHSTTSRSKSSATKPKYTSGERAHVLIYIDAASRLAHLDQRIYLASTTRDMLLYDCVTTSVWLKKNGVPFDVGTPEIENFVELYRFHHRYVHRKT